MNPELAVALWVGVGAVGLFALYFGYLLFVVHLNNRRFRRLLKTLGGTSNAAGSHRTRQWRRPRSRQG
jgi:hypothetical protein